MIRILAARSLGQVALALGSLVLGGCGIDGSASNQKADNTSPLPSPKVEDLGNGCLRTTTSLPPEWECDEEQLRLISGAGGTDGSAPVVSGALEAASCDALAELRRDFLRKGNHDYVTENYRSVLLAACSPREEVTYTLDGESVSSCGGCYYGGGDDYGCGWYGSATGGSASIPPFIGGDDEGAEEYSTTNNQVEGVEEADYVKNDSGHIYLLHAGQLHVFDSWPVESARELAQIPFDAKPRRLLLDGDRLVVFLQTGATDVWGSGECTYGYDCRFQAETGGTEVRVFDVGNPSQPALLKTYEFAAGYVASRRIGNKVFLVTNIPGGTAPRFAGLDFDYSSAKNYADARLLSEGYHATVDAVSENLGTEQLLPHLAGDEGTGCSDALLALGSTGTALTALVSIDLDTLAPAKGTLIAAPVGFVYASAAALYMSVDRGDLYDPATDSNMIHKFSLDGAAPKYRGSAEVKGHVLNQFAMDEREGVLRVATTAGQVPNDGTHSLVTTLRENAAHFEKWGELSGIAPTEDIRSVRFDGDRAFVVTFKKTDPLFTIGLADPAKPVVLGELKIPGFSTYMHPLDHDHLLAVGFEADDMGSFAFFDGIQIQIFDVSDLQHPQLLHKKTLGTRGTTSEALTNHLAFTYFAPKKTLALPVTVCEGGGNGAFGDQMTFSGVIAYGIDLESGITEKGRLPFETPIAEPFDYSTYGSCYSWWSGSSSTVKRTLFLDDYLFGISGSEIRAAHLDDLDTPIASLPLPEEPTNVPAPW